ncbi:MAG: alpha-galactosidase [Clostridia bacterium]|nr:alpha-galactosidase [Clostridia bacterium]
MQILNRERDTLLFENDYIRREITFCFGKPTHSSLTRKSSGYTWTSDREAPLLYFPGFDWDNAETTFDDGIVTFVSNYIVRWVFTVSENQPAIRTQLFARALPEKDEPLISADDLEMLPDATEPAPKTPDVTERVLHTGRHIKLRRIRFYDRTDGVNTLVRHEDSVLYLGEESFDGSLFFLTDPTVGETCMIQKEAPCGASHLNRYGSDLRASFSSFSVHGSGIDYDALSPDGFTAGYPVTIALGVAGEKENEALARAVYTSDCGGNETESGFAPFVMSNTWGDRSQDKCVSETFLKLEILRAVQIGVDIVQIDDGWQCGRTMNSALTKSDLWSGGYYANNTDFWVPDPEKFPSGFGELCKFAYEHNVALGLWFSPDGENDYANWQRDADTMLGFYRNYGIRHFKLDGMDIHSKTAEKNFLRMCFRLMMESEGRIVFQMDCTALSRLGYLYEKELGTLFVENRYSDWGNYYPHNTLRNLWQLSHYIPAQKMLFEVLNLTRNPDKYENDILAPAGYDIDYVFASVMASNPLIWCEMQHLPETDVRRLHELSVVYRQYREDFVEVIPVGECPDGFSLTGFYIRGREHDYYIGLRELSEKDTVRIFPERILHTNDTDLVSDENGVTFSGTRKYFFALLAKPAL